MIKFTPRFNRLAAGRVKQLVFQETEKQLSGLSPAERGEILKNILVERNPDGSSLKVTIATRAATRSEFGTRTIAPRPWIKKLQRGLAAPVRSALAQLLTKKP